MPIQFSRVWDMPNADTFDVPSIAGFVKKYLMKSKISIDPFARNKRWATYTNDLNPNTAAEYHLDAVEFLGILASNRIIADLVILDPPYSPRQISECYQGIGRKVTMQDTQNSALYNSVRKAVKPLVAEGGIVLSFGWNSHGFSNNGHPEWKIKEIMMVCHGSAHNDTICMSEQRIPNATELFDATLCQRPARCLVKS